MAVAKETENPQKIRNKFIYRSSPIFGKSDNEAIKAWEARTFDTMLVFCKLYRNEEGKYGIGYSVIFEDGWEHGSFHEHLGKAENIKEASLKGLFELLLHAQEESAKKVVIWSENAKFIESMDVSDIRSKKPLRELYDSFERVEISNIDKIEIENLERLRDSVFSSAKAGSKYRTRRKRFKVIMKVSEHDEPESVAKQRYDDFINLMGEIIYKYSTRPIEEKISDAENDLKELENNVEEQPQYEEKRTSILSSLEELRKQKTDFDARKELLEKERLEEEQKRIKKEEQRIAKIKKERNFCFKCNKKIEKDWQFCPYCSVTLTEPV